MVLQLRIVSDDGHVISEDEILRLDKGDERRETIGLSLDEAKAVLAGTQERLVTAQAAGFLARHRTCGFCARPLRHKGQCRIRFRTAFGTVLLASPRFHRCACRPTASRTFSPLSTLFTEHVAPELLYLETNWASLVSFGVTADLLRDVVPIGSMANPSTIRRHLHKVAARQENDPGGDRLGLIAGGPTDTQPEQDPTIVGIDGGYVRNWHDRKRNFEVRVGKSVPGEGGSRYFGLVQGQEDAPKRRLFEVLPTLGLPMNPNVTVLSDGGDSLRAFVGELSPGAVHYLVRWVLQAGPSYPTCGRGAGSLCITLASKPEVQSSAPLPILC
jgi:hypothetical protein